MKDSLSVIKDVVGKIDTKTVSAVMKGLANVASLAPGIGGLVSSFLNVVLAFIPQENPLKDLRDGFAEVNRKLDSLSIQISNLATDVEWFNYASVYSQDEICILNAWNKFNELRENSEKVQSEDDKLRLAEIFANYYENTGTEASVANLYHYLTVSSTSLSGNPNDLLKRKFKCGIREIGKYNVYFSSLLWRGMVLNQFYWKLIGFDLLDKTAEHTQMFKIVYTAQIAAVNFCLDNYERYMKDDVVEISKALSPDNKTAIADQVKRALDNKYYWYNWVVLVYNSNQDNYYILYDLTKILVDNTITIAVGITLKAEEINKPHIISTANRCFKDESCEINVKSLNCRYYFDNEHGEQFEFTFTEHAKATHAAYGNEFAEFPEPFHQHDCW